MTVLPISQRGHPQQLVPTVVGRVEGTWTETRVGRGQGRNGVSIHTERKSSRHRQGGIHTCMSRERTQLMGPVVKSHWQLDSVHFY